MAVSGKSLSKSLAPPAEATANYTRDYTRSPVVAMGWFGVGWGGDDDVPCTWTHPWCFGEVGWGWWRSLHMNTSLMLRRWCRSLHMNTSLMLRRSGVGWGWWRSLHMNTSLMLRRWCRSLLLNTSLMLRRTGVGCGGVGMMTFLAHEHIFDATEMMSFLAAALHRKPGIMSVLNALQLYRNNCSSGKICVAPKDAFDPDSLSWLA